MAVPLDPTPADLDPPVVYTLTADELAAAIDAGVAEAFRRADIVGKLDRAADRVAEVTGNLRAALDVLGSDPHQFGTRPCATCRTVSTLVGRPFGCSAVPR